MKKPDISPDFTVEDIRKLRDYNSERHLLMSEDEVREEGLKAMKDFLKEIGKLEKL